MNPSQHIWQIMTDKTEYLNEHMVEMFIHFVVSTAVKENRIQMLQNKHSTTTHPRSSATIKRMFGVSLATAVA
jgi:hypothetical protein